MIAPDTIHAAVQVMLSAAPRGSQIILFGSYARGDAGDDSDLDFLIVEPVVHDRHREMVRLRDALRPLGVPADVLVVSRAVFDAWSKLPNNVVFEAAREGQVFTHAA